MRHNYDECNNHEFEVKPNNFLQGNRCPKCFGNILKTHEEFVKEVYDLVGDEYSVLGNYINTKTKIRMKHNCDKCNNYEYMVAPGDFLRKNRGHRCPKCFGSFRKTQEEFENEVKALVGNEYTFLEEYINSNTKIRVRHNCYECNKHEYMVAPDKFLQGNRCPKCFGSPLKNQEEFEKEVKDLVGDEYSVLGKYINTKTKIKMKHNCDECNNHEYMVTPNNFLKGNRCPKCNEKLKTHEKFVKEVYDLVSDEYSVLGKYINSKTKIKMRHNSSNCSNHEYEVLPCEFLKGTRCPKCFGTHLKTQEEFEKEVYDLVKDEYNVIGKYVNTNTKIKMRHNCEKCKNYEYKVSPINFLRGERCPKCNESKGEKAISKYLNINSKRFKSQYRLQNCRSVNPLPFDIALLNDKKEIVGLIEYDGEQHFRAIKRFGGEEGFLERKTNDRIKTSYCENHLNSSPSYKIYAI